MSVRGRWADVLRLFLQQNASLEDLGVISDEEEKHFERIACSSLPSDAAESVTHSELDEMLSTNRDAAGNTESDDISLPPASPRTTPRITDFTSEAAAERRRRGLEEKIAKFNELQQRRREIQLQRSTENLDSLPIDVVTHPSSPGVIEVYDTRRRNLPSDVSDGLDGHPKRSHRRRRENRQSTLSTISSDDESGTMHRFAEYEPGPGVYAEPPTRQTGHIMMHPHLRSSFEQLYELGGMMDFRTIDVLSPDWMREEEEEESSSNSDFIPLPSKLRRASEASGDSTPRASDCEKEEEEEEAMVVRSRVRLERESSARMSDRPNWQVTGTGDAQQRKSSPQPPKRRSLPSVEEAVLKRKQQGERSELLSSQVPSLRTATFVTPQPSTYNEKHLRENGGREPRVVGVRDFAALRHSFESASQPSSDTESGHSFIRKASSRPSITPCDKAEAENEATENTEKNRLHSRFYAWSNSRPQHELDTPERQGMDLRLTQRSSMRLTTGGNPPTLEASEQPVVASTAASRQRSEIGAPATRFVAPQPGALEALAGLLHDQDRAKPSSNLRRKPSYEEDDVESVEEAWVRLEPRTAAVCEKMDQNGEEKGRKEDGGVIHHTPGYAGRREGPLGHEGYGATEDVSNDPDIQMSWARERRPRHHRGNEFDQTARNKPVGQEEGEAPVRGQVVHEMRQAPTHDYWVREERNPPEEVTRTAVGRTESGTAQVKGRLPAKARDPVGPSHLRISRPEGINRSAVGRSSMPQSVVGNRNVGYIGKSTAQEDLSKSRLAVSGSGVTPMEGGPFRSASVGPPLPPRQSHPTHSQQLNSQPEQLRQLLHGRPDQVVRARSFQSWSGRENGPLPSQERRDSRELPRDQVTAQRVNGSTGIAQNVTRNFQSPTRTNASFQHQNDRGRVGEAEFQVSNSFNGRIAASPNYQGQTDRLQIQMVSQAGLPGHARPVNEVQGQRSAVSSFQGQPQGLTRSVDHLQHNTGPNERRHGQTTTPNYSQGSSRSLSHLQGHLMSADPIQGQSKSFNHLQGQSISADPIQGQSRPFNHLQGQSISADPIQGQSRPFNHLQGHSISADPIQGQSRSSSHLQGHPISADPIQGPLRSSSKLSMSTDPLQGRAWPHEHFQARHSHELGSTPGPVTRSTRPSDLRSHSFNDDDLKLHPRRPSSRSKTSAGVQRHHSSVAAPSAEPPPLPPRQKPERPVSAVEAPPAPLERLRSTFEEADRRARGKQDDAETHREDFWREMDTLEREQRAGFVWDDDENAWVMNAAKEEPWKVLKDPGDRQDPVADLERMFLDLDLDRDDLMEKAERRVVSEHMLDRLKALREEAEDNNDNDDQQLGPPSPSHLPSASPLRAPSGASTLQSHASTTRSYNHIPNRAPFPHRIRDDKAYRRLHPNVQAPTLSRRGGGSFSSGANSGFVSGMATPAEVSEEKVEGHKMRSASSVRARAEPSPTSADYLLPRESGTLERRKQWPPPFAEDPDLKVDDMAYRRLVKHSKANKPRKDLIGKPRPTPFSEQQR